MSDDDVRECLQAIGVESQCQWDLMIFLYRHQTTLMSPESLATLMGSRGEVVTAALDLLEALQLVKRAGLHARLYEFTRPVAPWRRAALDRLLVLSGVREGRIAVRRHLRRDRSLQEGLENSRQFLADARRIAQMASRRSRAISLMVRQRRRQRDDAKPST